MSNSHAHFSLESTGSSQGFYFISTTAYPSITSRNKKRLSTYLAKLSATCLPYALNNYWRLIYKHHFKLLWILTFTKLGCLFLVASFIIVSFSIKLVVLQNISWRYCAFVFVFVIFVFLFPIFRKVCVYIYIYIYINATFLLYFVDQYTRRPHMHLRVRLYLSDMLIIVVYS